MVEEPEQETQSEPESYSSDDNYTLGMDPLRIDGIEKPMQWLSTVETQSGKVTFKLDTGAEANVIPFEVFNQLTTYQNSNSTTHQDKVDSIWWNHNKASGYMHPAVYK